MADSDMVSGLQGSIARPYCGLCRPVAVKKQSSLGSPSGQYLRRTCLATGIDEAQRRYIIIHDCEQAGHSAEHRDLMFAQDGL